MTCRGSKSCYQSNMNLTSGSVYLNCDGDQSCANSNSISSRSIVEIRGYLGAKNSILKSEDNSAEFWFKGTASGENSTVICKSGCTITCYSNACDNTNFECKNGEATCSFTYQCTHSLQNEVDLMMMMMMSRVEDKRTTTHYIY